MAQGKFWCFTLNNYSDEEYNKLVNFNCNYLIVGKEVGGCGTPHLQGYIEFKTNQRVTTLKKINERIHWERRKGNAQEASDYCKKDENYKEVGNISKVDESGKRSDIIAVREVVENGGGMKEVMEETNSYQAVRFAEKLLTYKEKKRNWEMEVIWLFGPTGCGKTKRAFEETNNPWVSGKNLKWWEGYDAHEDVIIDDFRADFCTYHEFLRILDRYPFTVEVKGGSRQLLAKRIYITSCYPPDKVYNTREDIGQLLRRITKIIGIGIGIEVAGNTMPQPCSDYEDL